MDPIDVSHLPARTLTATECEAEAQRCLESLDGCISGGMRRHLQNELRGWQRLAAERASVPARRRVRGPFRDAHGEWGVTVATLDQHGHATHITTHHFPERDDAIVWLVVEGP